MDTRWITAAVLGLAALTLYQGCGGEPLIPGDAPSNNNTLWTANEVETVVQDPGSVLVEEQTTTTAELRVSATAVAFDTLNRKQILRVQSTTDQPLTYRVTPNVIWLQVTPYEATAGAAGVDHEIEILSASLPPGDHHAILSVTGPNAQVIRISVTFSQNGPPTLATLADQVDFGRTATQALDVANVGPGTLSFTATTTADWLSVSPAQGTLESAPLQLTLSAARRPLYVGPHATTVVLTGDNGQVIEVPVALEKPATSPKIIPWASFRWNWPSHVEALLASAEHWSRVTDTIILDAERDKPYIEQFRAAYPNIKLQFGLMSTGFLGLNSFDSVSGWQAMSQAIEEAAQDGHERIVLLDHEFAMRSYHDGDVDIDLDQLRYCLTFVPDDVVIYWYPGVQWGSTPELGEIIHPRSLAVVQIANEEIEGLRIVDLSYGGSGFSNVQRVLDVRNEQDAFLNNPTVQMTWFGCTYATCWWLDEELNAAMAEMQGRDIALFYHLDAMEYWPEFSAYVADNISEQFFPD
jgi:hypothetical protein